jgi:hypothetical protein
MKLLISSVFLQFVALANQLRLAVFAVGRWMDRLCLTASPMLFVFVKQ